MIRPWKRSIVFKIVQVVVTFMSFVAISSVLPVACENFTGPHQFSGLSSHESPVGYSDGASELITSENRKNCLNAEVHATRKYN